MINKTIHTNDSVGYTITASMSYKEKDYVDSFLFQMGVGKVGGISVDLNIKSLDELALFIEIFN